MANICNPVAAAEIVGREYIESQLPTRDSFRTRSIIDNIIRINENSKDVDSATGKIKDLHGVWSGSSNTLVSFTKNIFGDDPAFIDTILELEKTAIALVNIKDQANDLVDNVKDLTLAETSDALVRGYLRNVKILLPDGVSNKITDAISTSFPLFTDISESLGSVYYNMALSDNAVDMVDSIIGDTLDATGLSNVLSQHVWIRMIPEYALNFHNNVRLFQRLGSRVLPKCTYSKVFHKMDEPLAHIYDLARDALTFADILENRKKYLQILIGGYGDLLKKINNIFPMCHEYSVDNIPKPAIIGGETVNVDILGNKTSSSSTTSPVIIAEK